MNQCLENKAIGGYFGLELSPHTHYHKSALKLNTAKNCLEYILRLRKYKNVYIPVYTCNVVKEPFNKLGIKFTTYNINYNLEPTSLPTLNQNEAFLYTNYFGIKGEFINSLAEKYKKQLIIDNAQAFFDNPLAGIDTFYSARKFFGVPDGAYLYVNQIIDEEFPLDVSYKRMEHLLKRVDLTPEDGYNNFKTAEEELFEEPIKRMSTLTDTLLSSIDYRRVAQIRRNNFSFLHSKLQNFNQLKFEITESFVPMVYPFLSIDKNLKSKLISNRIFIPTYWSNIDSNSIENPVENHLIHYLCPCPIDQRYSTSDMSHIIANIL